MRKLLLLLLTLAMLMGCTAVQNQSELAAKSLLTTRQAIITAATTVDALCTAGKVKQADCDKAKTLYLQSQAAYALASDSLIVALGTGDYQTYQIQAGSLSMVFTDLNALVLAMTPKEGGPK